MRDHRIEIRDSRYALLSSPTQLQRLHNLEAKIGRGRLYMKRDDHMPIAMGGNKLRSLEFWLGAAHEAGADTVIVAGGAASNLCRLTAAAAAMADLRCVVVHNSIDTPENRKKSFLNKVFGAEVQFLGDVSEYDRRMAAQAVATRLKSRGRVPYVVGDEVVGALGYVIAAFELQEQSLSIEQPIKHVFLAGSMGPTEAGFVFGNALLGNPFQIHLVSVEYDRNKLVECVKRIYDKLRVHTGFEVAAFEQLQINYHMDYLGGGYGCHSDESEQAILLLARTEGILTEYVYTAKTLAGFLDLIATRQIPENEPACIVHTGGVPSLFAQFDMFKLIDSGMNGCNDL